MQVDQPHSPEDWTCKEPPQVMAREPLIWVELREWGDYLQMSRTRAGGLGAHLGLSRWLPKLPPQSYELCPPPSQPPQG